MMRVSLNHRLIEELVGPSEISDVLISVAMLVPRKDEWKQGSTLTEALAQELDRCNIPRPDHYPDDWK
jgi:hypothetical protein